jgi:uncharacterized protein YlxW (UPF0749 family)
MGRSRAMRRSPATRRSPRSGRRPSSRSHPARRSTSTRPTHCPRTSPCRARSNPARGTPWCEPSGPGPPAPRSSLLGFAVVAQVRLTHDTSLSTLRQSDLVGILDQATRQADELQREAATLEQTRQELESGSNSRQAALDAATRSAATQGILTGRLPAEGPGIVVTLTEPDGSIRALTLLNFLEELRNSGAEAVQLNDQRLTASSYFVAPAEGDGVVVDGTTLHAPYRWIVIGDADVMATALDIPGGALASVRNDGGRGSVLRKELVSVTATRSVPVPVNATPVLPKG